MRRKVLFAYLMVLLLVVVAAGYILFVNPGFISILQTGSNIGGDGTSTQSQTKSADPNDESSSASDEGEQEEAAIISELIDVDDNTPEYDLHAVLSVTNLCRTYLTFTYYNEGQGIEKVFDSITIPELNRLFENRYDAGSQGGYQITQMMLNPKTAQVYFCVIGARDENSAATSVYCFDLRKDHLRRIYSAFGDYTALVFNKSYSHMAFSFRKHPASGIYRENSLLQVFDCASASYSVLHSRNAEGVGICGRWEEGLVCDYTFISWHNDTAIELRQKILNESDHMDIVFDDDVIYDLLGDTFLSDEPDGTDDGNEDDGDTDGTVTDSLKVLQDFYLYCAADDYDNAIDLLADDFSMKLDLLAQFGVQEITKTDLDEESVTLYKDILKTAKLLEILEEDLGNTGISTISYLQELNIVEGSPVVMPLVAVIAETSEGWRIKTITDGDI